MLKLEGLAIGYRARRQETLVATGIDLTLASGEFVCLLGANGAGKSTLLRTIAGMQPPLAGRVLIDGVDISLCGSQERAKLVSVVLTERTMAGLLTGRVMVSLGRYPHTGWFGALSPEDHQIVEGALKMTGAVSFGDRLVGELSDGERQRVMLARALAQQPKLLILDEITAFLDLPRRVEVMELLRGLARDSGRTVLISTHDLDLALRNADRVLLMGSDGRLRDGAPEDLVLNGDFSGAFDSDNIDFDPMRGAFQIQRNGDLWIRLKGGSPLKREWTKRAIERKGYRLCNATEQVSNVVAEIDLSDADGWTLQDDTRAQKYRSIYELISVLPASAPQEKAV
ncbi:MAG: ABC transporter ATP-binding protein [Pseudomonadota bacterium]